MTAPPEPPALRLSFDHFELDITNARLCRAGVEVPLPPKSFALLAHLAQRPGELVLKDTLLDTVWGRRFVSEGAVKTVVSELRAALGDDARAPRWIETVQRRGYRFLGQVRPADSGPATAPPAPPTPPSTPAAAPLPMPLPAAPTRGNLPAGLQRLVGRTAAWAQVATLLDNARLVTICGPAGVGKTSLALAVADGRRTHHPGGVWLVELAPLPADSTDAAALRGALARACQIPPASVPDDAALAQALAGQGLLLVLDNAEHVLEPLAPLVGRLQRELPQLQWLVTSREPLQIPGEQVLRLAPLSLPTPGDDEDPAQLQHSGAMQLLVQRVAARLPGFEPGPGQRRAMAQVCRALDGLPLALELAAARVPVLGMHGLAAHLADDSGTRLQLLTQASRTAEPHQRTLRSALDWSHTLLKPAEQRAFRRLAVFRGGFTLAAAQAVCADPGEAPLAVLDALEALVEKSMVAVSAQGQHETGAGTDANTDSDTAPRFTLLESLREYASEQGQAADETAATHRRHLAWMRGYWAAADGLALSQPGMAWTARHLPELDNLRVAMRWGQAQARPPGQPDPDGSTADWLALVGHSAMLWQRAGLMREAAPGCLAARPHAEQQPDALLRAGVDLALAGLSRYMPLLPPTEALALSERAAAAYRAAGDAERAYFSLYLAWALALEEGEHVPRGHFVDQMAALVQPGWNALLRRYAGLAAAQDQRLQGNFQAFLQHSREAYVQFRDLGAQGETWSAGMGLVWAEHDLGHTDRAITIGAALVDDIRAAGRLRTYAQLLAMHTTMRAESGDVAGTRALLPEALPMLATVSACEVLHLALAWLAAHEGRDEDAARLLGWFDSPTRGGGAYGPNTFTRRTATALGARLDTRLGAARRQALQADAAGLGDERAQQIGLARPQTDGNPTAS
ncbi:MAG: helix-turn-helix transcriptional regulator [Rubrivivax sp.]|nr:helix-turn-helix transcriptional regulator [Rubrivivax sp.]